MDANIRRPLPGPVAPLALKSESLQEVAQFEAFAQNLLNHEQGACRSTAAIGGGPVNVGYWHNPVALATGQPVRLLG
jgi:hypothetical protein